MLPAWLIAAILGVVEGLTEFIPVSSTGHLIVFDELLKFKTALNSPDRAELFEVFIQLGAILAVGYYFRQKLFRAVIATKEEISLNKLRMHLAVAFLPAAIMGFLFHKVIKEYLFSPASVAVSLIVGGFIIIIVERVLGHRKHERHTREMTTKDAFWIGVAQIFSLIPGTSRSAATIIGGMLTGLSRAAATEFSFLLSFPVMIAAAGYELFKYRHELSADMTGILAIGFVLAFASALVVVAWLIKFVQRHSFVGFGIYRILFGALILALYSIQWF